MDEIQAALRTAFEDAGHDVATVSTNRDQYRVTVLDDGAEADELRTLVYEVVDESEILGTNVTTESVDGKAGMGTVIEFRHRPGT